MSIQIKYLGGPATDAAALVTIDWGQGQARILLDCGDGRLRSLPKSEIQSLDHLFFSHFHMDHIAGFDAFFRKNYSRNTMENHLWGPPGADRILSARLQGYLWNLCDTGPNSVWWIHEIHENRILSARRELHDAFKIIREFKSSPRADSIVLQTPNYRIESITLPHHTASLGYVVTEADRWNVNTKALQESGIRPGPWVAELKQRAIETASGERPSTEIFEVESLSQSIQQWTEQFLELTAGSSVAYLTDFRLDEPTSARVAHLLSNRRNLTLLCESQYMEEDLELAEKTAHSTCREAALLAKAVQPDQFLLFHLSDRYRPSDREHLLQQAQAIYPKTRFAWEQPLPEQTPTPTSNLSTPNL